MISNLANQLRRNGVHFCNCGATALLLGLFLLSVVSLGEGSASKLASLLSPGTTAAFAIADFDGDQLPDIATVQTGRSDFHESRYSICFQLSAGSNQTIGLTAPPGGLQLDSRDVNGDHLTDLIVSTTWFGRPVAILLNDGHGKFTLVDPGAFPAAMRVSRTTWSEPSLQTNDISAIPPSRPFPKVLQTRSNKLFSRDDSDLALRSTVRVRILKQTFASAGRPPPVTDLPVQTSRS